MGINLDDPRPRFDTTTDYRLWRQQLYNALQALHHLGKEPKPRQQSLGSSFQLAMQKLYHDSHFSAFTSSRAWEQAGLGRRAEEELRRLQNQLDAFDEPDADEELADDAQWQAVLAQVLVVTALLA